jgi:hypothetical protein
VQVELAILEHGSGGLHVEDVEAVSHLGETKLTAAEKISKSAQNDGEQVYDMSKSRTCWMVSSRSVRPDANIERVPAQQLS